MSAAFRCPWCDRPFRPRQGGGREQKFCRPSCRRAFHADVRRWVLNAIENGTLTGADIRKGFPATRALLQRAEEISPMVRRRRIVLEAEILPNTIADLRRLGWLDDTSHFNDTGIADAVVELVERAIALRLRPR